MLEREFAVQNQSIEARKASSALCTALGQLTPSFYLPNQARWANSSSQGVDVGARTVGYIMDNDHQRVCIFVHISVIEMTSRPRKLPRS
jgi:hypothetical protein